MKIKLNNEVVTLPDDPINVSALIELRKIPQVGTAVACNGKLVPHSRWDEVLIRENDDVVIISAAYGG